jgi:hypothetical protein
MDFPMVISMLSVLSISDPYGTVVNLLHENLRFINLLFCIESSL